MGWFFDKLKRCKNAGNAPEPKHSDKRDRSAGLWATCPACGKATLITNLIPRHFLCPECDNHMRMPACHRIGFLADDSSFVEFNAGYKSCDPLKFVDSKPYVKRVDEAYKKSDSLDAIATGHATIGGIKVILGVMDFDFMGGSMGSVVGEKVTACFEKAAEEKLPLVIVSTSGGARMQEGIFSLMQMAKTSAAVKKLHEAGVPFISILTDPTTGGVSASFASLGDFNIAEPDSLICFAGPRVIKQTIKQDLPEGFQRSRFLLEHGMLDCVIHRRALKSELCKILRILSKAGK